MWKSLLNTYVRPPCVSVFGFWIKPPCRIFCVRPQLVKWMDSVSHKGLQWLKWSISSFHCVFFVCIETTCLEIELKKKESPYILIIYLMSFNTVKQFLYNPMGSSEKFCRSSQVIIIATVYLVTEMYKAYARHAQFFNFLNCSVHYSIPPRLPFRIKAFVCKLWGWLAFKLHPRNFLWPKTAVFLKIIYPFLREACIQCFVGEKL